MEIYVSTDIETDGPIPGEYSMLSLASLSFTPDGRLIGQFEINLKPLDGAKQHPETMAWWGQRGEAWEAATTGAVDPALGMQRYRDWLESGDKDLKPVFVAYPAGFDFMFVYWYLIKFTGGSPFSFSALDMKTYAHALLGGDYRDASKRNWPKEWLTDGMEHTHKAYDDAYEQGVSFIKMLRSRERLLEAVKVSSRHK